MKKLHVHYTHYSRYREQRILDSTVFRCTIQLSLKFIFIGPNENLYPTFHPPPLHHPPSPTPFHKPSIYTIPLTQSTTPRPPPLPPKNIIRHPPHRLLILTLHTPRHVHRPILSHFCILPNPPPPTILLPNKRIPHIFFAGRQRHFSKPQRSLARIIRALHRDRVTQVPVAQVRRVTCQVNVFAVVCRRVDLEQDGGLAGYVEGGRAGEGGGGVGSFC